MAENIGVYSNSLDNSRPSPESSNSSSSAFSATPGGRHDLLDLHLAGNETLKAEDERVSLHFRSNSGMEIELPGALPCYESLYSALGRIDLAKRLLEEARLASCLKGELQLDRA